MAKRKQVRKVKAKATKPNRAGTVMMDGAAMDHIKLLADPCMGKMVYPAYASSTNGCLMRFRSLVQIGTSGGETCGAFHWVPGVNFVWANGAATTTTAYTPSATSNYPFLVTNSGNSTGISFRCVAACARVIFNGSEMNRGGIVYAGNTNGATYGTGNATNVNQVLSMLPYTARTPSKFMEVLWVPNEEDMVPYTDSNTVGVGIGEGPNHAAITVAVAGLPAATGVSIECTGVYEVIFGANNNLVSSVGAPPSATPWGSVLRGFFSAVKGSTVLLDGVSKALDYVGPNAAATLGANVGRLAISYL